MLIAKRKIVGLILQVISLLLISCSNDVTCPTGHLDQKEIFANASSGKSTQKKRTENGIIIKKNPKKKTKKHKS
jgi:hypothetical protein